MNLQPGVGLKYKDISSTGNTCTYRDRTVKLYFYSVIYSFLFVLCVN